MTEFHEQVFAELDQLRKLIITLKKDIWDVNSDIDAIDERVRKLEGKND